MAEYAVMPYADYEDACEAVREKTGGTAVIKSGEMGAQIRAIDTQENLDAELSAQDDLIAQISVALEGKAAASVETCTVTINDFGLGECRIYMLATTVLESGELKPCFLYYGSSAIYEATIQNVVCGASIFMISNLYVLDPLAEIDGTATFEGWVDVSYLFVSSNVVASRFCAPTTANEDCTINFAYNV